VTTGILVLAGYFAGSLPFGLWLVRAAKGIDIRTQGSGNIGATNVWRTCGAAYGLPVALLDAAKGFAPALLATILVGPLAGALAGGASMLGHWRPVFLRFARGGKMVATCAGALLGVAPAVAGLGAGVWVAVFVLFRYASVASIVAALALPLIALALDEPWPVLTFAAAAAAAVALLHRANVARLRAGTESRFRFRRGRKRAHAGA
jgi:glycerol-3-phosphate acyltransferase PlsY